MPRSIWNGTIALGPLEVPVKTYSATEDQTIHFHQVHAADGARIKQKRICFEEGVEVPYEEIAKGYPLDDGEYLLLTGEEVASVTEPGSRVIELEQFVPADQIDPVYFDHSYYLGLGASGQSAYRLLHEALLKSGRIGVGRWSFHSREYLVAIRPLQQLVVMHTMRFAAELVTPSSLGIPNPSKAPAKREVEMAAMLVEALYEQFDPSQYTDTYRERVLALIDSKAAGEEVPTVEEPVPAAPAPDLMSALQASLDAAGKGRGGKQRASTGARARGGQRATTKPAKKSSAKTPSRQKS